MRISVMLFSLARLVAFNLDVPVFDLILFIFYLVKSFPERH